MTVMAETFERVCQLEDLVPYSGVAALLHEQQIALFFIPHLEPRIYAVANFDPISQANVMARGIIGDFKGELCVASPIYKQHFSLLSGQCFEQPELSLKTWSCRLVEGVVELAIR